jgi:hypothetical protein
MDTGTPTLTASSTGLTSATTQFTISQTGSQFITSIAQGAPFTVSDGALSLNTFAHTYISDWSSATNAFLTTVTPSNLTGSGSIPSGWIIGGSQVSGNINGNATSITGTIQHDKISDWDTATSSFVTSGASVSFAELTVSGTASLFGIIPVGGSLTISGAVGTIVNSLDDGSGNTTWGGYNAFKDTGLVLNVHWDPGNNGFFEELPPVQGYSYYMGGPYIDPNVRTYLWVTRISPADRSSAPYDPMLTTNFALFVEKDTQTFGFLGTSSDPQKHTGGGAILMGQGLNGVGYPPSFSLTGVRLYQNDAQAQSLFPGPAHGTILPNPTGNRAKYYKTDVQALYEDTPIFNESNEKIGQGWKFRGLASSIGHYPTAYSANSNELNYGLDTGKYWYDTTNKRLMAYTSTEIAPNLQSDKYDTLFLVSGDSQVDQPFQLGNLYLNRVQCNQIYNAQNTWVEIYSKLNINGNFQLNGNVVTSLNPDQSVSGTIGLGSPEQQYQGAFIQSPYVNDIYPIPAANGGHGTYIGIQTKLNVIGDFQITGGHVVASLNPSGSVALGSPTEVWSGINVTTAYMSILSKLNGTSYIQLTDPLYVNGSVGSSGQVLTSRGAGASPQWTTPTSQATLQKGSVNTDASGVATVIFPQAFGSTPSITCTTVDASGRHIAVVITAQSATQFSIKTTLTGDHKHKVGDIFGTDAFGLSVNSVGDHTHSFSAGAHTHMIGTISATTGWAMGIDSQGTHNHTVVGTTGVGGSHNHTVVGTTGTGSSHYHNMQNHTHGMSGTSTNTGTTQSHTHTYYVVSGWTTGGPSSNSTTSESSHSHNYSGYSSDADNHTHNYSGYSGDSGSHSHNLTNKPPYVRSLMLRDSGGAQHDLGALLTNTTDSQFDLYTLSSGGGGGTTGSAGGHTHSLSNKPAYTRGVSLRNSGGGSFTIGGVLSNESAVGTTEAHTEITNTVSNIAIAVNWIAVG